MRKLSNQKDMRRKVIGGVSEEDVNLFIQNIQGHYDVLEKDLNQRIEELTTSNSKLQTEFDQYIENTITIEEKNELQNSLEQAQNDSFNYLNQCEEKDRIIADLQENPTNPSLEEFAILENQLRSSRNDLEESLRINMELSNQMNQVETHHSTHMKKSTEAIAQLETALAESKEKELQLINEHQDVVTSLEEKLKQPSSTNKSNSDIHAIFKQLDGLKDQVTIINNLNEELEMERKRADEAEQAMTQVRSWLQELMDKFYTEQEQLESQFTNIQEKYNTIQNDVNGFETKLTNFRSITGLEMDVFLDTLPIKNK